MIGMRNVLVHGYAQVDSSIFGRGTARRVRQGSVASQVVGWRDSLRT
ncbi:HepT-like ribonuclease domain-containing protein [Gordonia asplenii]